MSVTPNDCKYYDAKIVTSGNVIEIYEYSEPVAYGFQVKENNKKSDEKPIDWNGKSEHNLRRARTLIRRIVSANITKYSKFLTLTYADNISDLNQFKEDFKRFRQRMYRSGIKLKYLYVLEFQERGAIHAHLVVFNDEYIPWQTIKNAWQKGNIDIHSIKKVTSLGAYVCKYLTKETMAEYNSFAYCVSQGLKRPIEQRKSPQEDGNFLKAHRENSTPKFSNTYKLTYMDEDGNEVEKGLVTYTQLIKEKTL